MWRNFSARVWPSLLYVGVMRIHFWRIRKWYSSRVLKKYVEREHSWISRRWLLNSKLFPFVLLQSFIYLLYWQNLVLFWVLVSDLWYWLKVKLSGLMYYITRGWIWMWGQSQVKFIQEVTSRLALSGEILRMVKIRKKRWFQINWSSTAWFVDSSQQP